MKAKPVRVFRVGFSFRYRAENTAKTPKVDHLLKWSLSCAAVNCP